MAKEKEKRKLSAVQGVYRETVIEVLKAGIVWKDLLNDFERRFLGDFGLRYAQFGEATTVVGEQWKIFEQIAFKLNLPCQEHAVAATDQYGGSH